MNSAGSLVNSTRLDWEDTSHRVSLYRQTCNGPAKRGTQSSAAEDRGERSQQPKELREGV
jgi:hypothetical protein